MEIQLIRHATLYIQTANKRLLVDPMLSEPGVNPPIPNTPNPRSNPLVPMPFYTDNVIDVDAVLVTHTHRDHWDEAAARLIPKHLPIFCQPEDEQKIRDSGFVHVFSVTDMLFWGKIKFIRTPGQHGTGEIGTRMAPVSGFLLYAENEPSVYIAGDTIFCPEVEHILRTYQPEVVVVNAGAAQFLEGDPITMTEEDVLQVAKKAPNARIVAVHMEAINHCLLTRDQLRETVTRQGLSERVWIPLDGESCSFDCSLPYMER
jgi:L-ascorbate metabolism protein UlaG (beta-lactamase superfamily)